MRGLLLSAALAACALVGSSTGAAADCVETWEGASVDGSGTVHKTGSWSGGWWFTVALETSDGCDIDEVWGLGAPPSCYAGGHFSVVGRFEYDDEEEEHFYLWEEDVLVIFADSISCS